MWSTAFALGTLLHEWQTGQPPWTVHGLAAIAAIGVLLRPASLPRVLVLLAVLAAELAVDLPDPWNHTVVAGMIGGGIVVWWLVQVVRFRTFSFDAGYVLRRVGPFLRVAFVLTWFLAAFAKLNTGFTNPVATCAVWILEAVPFVTVPMPLRSFAIAGTIALELSIPVLLFFRRTRPLAIVAGFGFHLVSALAGHTAFSGLAWSFYLLFLPVTSVASAATVARRATLSAYGGTRRAWVGAAAIWVLALSSLQLLPVELLTQVKRWVPALAYIAWSAVWAALLLRLRRHWITAVGQPHGALQVRHPVFIAVLCAVLLSAASPYLGSKTKYSFTMYSNLRTEPERWNHLVVPEAVRIFYAQEGLVTFREVSDPAMSAEIAAGGGHSLVLMHARSLAHRYPEAAVVYEWNKEIHSADPVGDDPVLGGGVSLPVEWLGGFRQVPEVDSCQH